MNNAAAPVHESDPLLASLAAAIDGYAALSDRCAQRSEVRLAVLAAWSADVHVLQQLLWESGLGEAPNPAEPLTAVADAVAGSMQAYLGSGPQASTAAAAVEDGRRALAEAFDSSVHDLLASRFIALDHLAELPPLEQGATAEAVVRRLDGRSVTELVDDLRTTATDCIAVARAMAEAGQPVNAAHQAYMADLASFEAYLLSAAGAVGDATFATVDLRWALAGMKLGDVPAGDPLETIAAVRDRLVSVVSVGEQQALRSTFETFGPVALIEDQMPR